SVWSSCAEKGTARGGALRGWWRWGNDPRARRCIPRWLVVEHGGGSHRKSYSWLWHSRKVFKTCTKQT
ncbi:hypothetical protein A2U01_0104169, partial [Trifolium medium]|nr:hypothetical protein [Trifolium medium]